MKLKFLFCKILFSSLILLSSISQTYQQCNTESGCLRRDKFIVWATNVGKSGEISNDVSDVNYKILYLLDNVLSILDSNNPNDKVLEEEPTMGYGINTSRMVRIIPYSQIVLDCGTFRNKLCTVNSYPNQSRIKRAIGSIKAKAMSENVESNCIVIPFYEYSYNNEDDKVALLCKPDSRDLYDILNYLDILSEVVEKTQLKDAENKSTSFNGIERAVHRMITYDDKHIGIPVSVQVKLNKIILWSDDKKYSRDYSLFEIREPEAFAAKISKAMVKNPTKVDNWNSGLKPLPSEECCFLLNGFASDLLLCVADDSGALEKNNETCESELKSLSTEVHDFIFKLKLTTAYNKIMEDEVKQKKCENKYWNVFRNRLQATTIYVIKNCKAMMTYIQDSQGSKLEKCKGSYTQSLEHEKQFLTRKSPKFAEFYNRCVVDKKVKLFEPEYLQQALESMGLQKTESFFFKQVENREYHTSDFNQYEELDPFFSDLDW